MMSQHEDQQNALEQEAAIVLRTTGIDHQLRTQQEHCVQVSLTDILTEHFRPLVCMGVGGCGCVGVGCV